MRYAFEVNTKANKVEIKKAVEAAYGVSVEKVRTMNVRPEERPVLQNRYSAW
jgi:large subunit ribosomal protein L23